MSTMYEVLGIAAGADPGQVRAAYHALAKSYHPDVNCADVTSEGRFKDISEAHEILSDPKRRAAYNLGLKHKHAETHRRVLNAMATTAVSFMITVGCGLYYFLPSASSIHESWTTSVGPEVSSSYPTPQDLQAKRELTTRPEVEVPVARPADHGMKVTAGGALGRTPPQRDLETQRQQALHLHIKGMEQIAQGNLLAARSFFALAAKTGLKRSMRALAGTYDPVQLEQLKVLGMQPDVDAARMWYEKAGDLAAATASRRDAVAELEW
jgi:curved DNA-binding protein CbpA